MELKLMCGHCNAKWTVARWTPAAMACPKCGSKQLGDGRSQIEEQGRITRKRASEERKRLEQTTPHKLAEVPVGS
jgi:ribosomal protein L40E